MQDNSNIASYRKIMKGTSIFGGVQIFNILIILIRGKFIALLLGTAGMGYSSLLQSAVTMVQQFVCLGLNLPAVKDISQAYEADDLKRLSFVIRFFRRLLFASGILGALALIVFSKYLSKFAFGDKSHYLAFILLSIMIFFTILSGGESAILQGCRRLKQLAYSTLCGSIVGLIIGVPLYYFLGISGIVPAMIILALSTYIFNKYHSRKIKLEKIDITFDSSYSLGKEMIALGSVSMISSFIGSASVYILNAFVSNVGNISDVGLFQAASSITNQYVGIVFAAMAVDYFPRLAAVANNEEKTNLLVNQQSEIVLLIITPLVVLLIITAPILVRILLSSEFTSVIPIIRWMGLGILFKSISYPMGYISFSKGDKKTFFILEGVVGNIIVLSINIICYSVWGIVGLGVSFLCSYIVVLLIYIVVVRARYNFHHALSFYKLFIPSLLLCLLAFISSFYDILLIELLILFICIAVTYRGLDKRLDIKSILFRKIK